MNSGGQMKTVFPVQKSRRVIRRSQIMDEFLACPYCGDGPKSYDESYRGCCGESSAHYERVYDLGDETVSIDDVDVVEDEE